MVARVLCVLGLSSLVCLAACVGGCSGGGSGGGSSSTAPQAAIITSISPTSVQAGAGATTLQVTGSSFVSGSVVTFSGQNLSTTYSSATSLTAVIPAASLSAGETAEIAVVNPGAVASGNVAFAVDSPTPALTSVSPSSAVAGSSGTFTLTGTGFEPNSVVHLNGAALTTVFVSTTSLTVNLTAAQLLQAGTDQVTVVNPAPAGGISPFVYLQITQPVPVLQSISPSSVLAGSGPVMLTLTGTNFLPTATVTANGNALNVTGQSSTSITATLPASAVAQGAILSLLVTNPGPNSESSAPQNFAVIGIPSISLLSPVLQPSEGRTSRLLSVEATSSQTVSSIGMERRCPLPTAVSAN